MKLSKMILTRIQGKLPGKEAVRENLKLLHAGTDSFKEMELYYTEKINLLLKVFVVGLCMAALAGVVTLMNHNLSDGRFLPRQKYAYRQELRVTPKEGDSEEITILVEPQKLSAEESQELLKQMVAQMEEYILGENVSLEEVRHDLRLKAALSPRVW